MNMSMPRRRSRQKSRCSGYSAGQGMALPKEMKNFFMARLYHGMVHFAKPFDRDLHAREGRNLLRPHGRVAPYAFAKATAAALRTTGTTRILRVAWTANGPSTQRARRPLSQWLRTGQWSCAQATPATLSAVSVVPVVSASPPENEIPAGGPPTPSGTTANLDFRLVLGRGMGYNCRVLPHKGEATDSPRGSDGEKL